MRHHGSCCLHRSWLGPAIGVLALAGGIGDSAGAPLDFLFGDPPLASRPAYHLRRRPAAPLPQAEAPLPVPRPRFPDDPPTGTPPAEPREAAPRPEPAAAPADSAPAEPGSVPPLPPPKPADLGGPAQSAAPSDVPKPEAPKTETPRAEPTKSEAPKSEAPKTESPASSSPAPAALPTQPPTSPLKPPEIAKPGAPPAVAPSGATTAFTPRSPDDDPQCPSRLQAAQVDVAPIAIGPQPDERCTVVQAVRLAGLALADGGKVSFPDQPTIACTTADAFAAYVRDLLVPLAKGTFGSPVTAVWTGPGLECRSRDHVFGAKLSAHGQGLAIDIAQLKLADGRLVEVGTPKTDAETGFETAARAGACGYFHTVLGPGSDAYHRTHWHFDLEVRGAKGDSKYCK